jgi:tetratricopeptide (TPR) repeat protein
MIRFDKSFLVSGAILLLFSIAVIQLPLLNYLGYEFSLVIALAVPWFCGIPAMRTFRTRLPLLQGVGLPEVRRAARDALRQSGLILLLPVVVATANAFFVRNCSYLEGLLFYSLIPGITAFWCVGLALFCRLLFPRPQRAYWLFIVLVLIYPLYIGYFSPQIYSYDFIYGFFPGFSHDEVLTITPGLLLFRLVTVLTGLLLFCVAQFLVINGLTRGKLVSRLAGFSALLTRRRLHGWIGLLCLVCALAWVLRDRLGFETSEGYLEQTLGSTYSTDHFRIYYSSESYSPSEIKWVAALHEFRFSQVEAALQVHFRGKVASYVYPDGDTKQRMIGTKMTNIAKPWRREIHIEKSSLESTLKHELVHVLAGEFGLPIIKIHYHAGIVEGLATAVGTDFGNRTLDEYAAAAKKFAVISDPRSLINPVGFALKAPGVSYVLMGSFCKYLIDRYGIVLFRSLYGGKSPSVVYGKSFDGLIGEWQRYLDRFDVPESWRPHVEFYFKRPSIFARECARQAAKHNERGYSKLAAHDPADAMEDFSAGLRTSWNSESYAGLMRSAYDAGRYDTVVELMNSPAIDSLHRTGLLNLNLLYGDALWHRDDFDGAKAAYQQILALDLSEPLDEAAAVRIESIEDPGLRLPLREYFMGSRNDSSSLQLLDDIRRRSRNPFVAHLEGGLCLRMRMFDKSIELLDPVAGKLSSPILNARSERMIGEAEFRLKNFEQARAHFWQALNFIANASSAQRIDDWIDRCGWYEKYGGKFLDATP